MQGCGPPFLDLTKIPNIYSVPLNDEERDSWQEFKKFDDGTPTLYAITSSLSAQHKRPLQLEHPFVRVVGEFAIASFNKACEMHVKKGYHNNIYDYEFMECKYLKFTRDYVFSMTIEAIEEGKIGVYEAKVSCDVIDGSRSLIKFFLTDRSPVGERAMATNVKSIYKTLKGKKNGKAAAKSKKHHQKAMNGEKKDKVAAKLIRLKKHHNKVIEGLRNVLDQEQWYPFQQDSNPRANQAGWSLGRREPLVEGTTTVTQWAECRGSTVFGDGHGMEKLDQENSNDGDLTLEQQQAGYTFHWRNMRSNVKNGQYILVTNLPLCTYELAVRQHFRRYGVVEKVHFKHRRDQTYTLACTVKMQDISVVNQILNVEHVINGFRVKVQLYNGKNEHLGIYKRGKFKLQVGGFPITRGKEMHSIVQNWFRNCPHSGIEMKKNRDTNQYTGFAEIRFKALYKLRANEIAESLQMPVATPDHTFADCITA